MPGVARRFAGGRLPACLTRAANANPGGRNDRPAQNSPLGGTVAPVVQHKRRRWSCRECNGLH
eukprot:6593018-Alexandrium_andersonii.AAC.1